MKKYLLIFMGVLSLFFFSDSVSALSFAANGEEITVNEETFIYYCYSLHPNILEYDNILTFLDNNGRYQCRAFNSSSEGYTVEFVSENSFKIFPTNPIASYIFKNSFSVYNAFDSVDVNFGSSLTISKLLNHNFNIYNYEHTTELYKSSNITKQDILNYFGKKKFNINFYINNEIYKQVEVEEGSSFDISEISYIPPKNYNFNGWNLENVDLTNITSDLNIYGTTTYIRPDMNYSENIDSLIHEISISIIGKNIPVEFDYIYTVMDFIILLVLVFCVVMPFVIIIKLLGGRW